MKWVLVLIVLVVVTVVLARKLRGSRASLRDADPRKLRDEFRRNSGD
ncbi:hypothetical protein [Kineococcus sp. SYSU DK003]